MKFLSEADTKDPIERTARTQSSRVRFIGEPVAATPTRQAHLHLVIQRRLIIGPIARCGFADRSVAI